MAVRKKRAPAKKPASKKTIKEKVKDAVEAGQAPEWVAMPTAVIQNTINVLQEMPIKFQATVVPAINALLSSGKPIDELEELDEKDG